MSPSRPSARVVLTRALGPTGLLIAGVSVLMLVFSLFVLKRDYDRLEQARSDLLRRIVGRWARTASADYLGRRSLIDLTDAWRRANPDDEPEARTRVQRSLDQMGEWFEEQNQKAPLVEIVSMEVSQAGAPSPIFWQSSASPLIESETLEPVTVLPASGAEPAIDLTVQYRSEPEVVAVVSALETSYRRLLVAVFGLSAYSVLCLVYMVYHGQVMHSRISREAAQRATLDLADRTCHELGNVTFVLSNERRNLTDHLSLMERYLDEQAAILESAMTAARLDPAAADRLRRNLRRAHADRGLDPEVELRAGLDLAREITRQVAICSDYIGLTVRELDAYLKQSSMPVQLGPVDAQACLDDARSLLGPSLDPSWVTFEGEAPGEPHPRALADRRLLVHALVNLLKNAAEACLAGGREPVIALALYRKESALVLEIADNGPGISEE
ncbi:MAG TPA: hypothetical protein VFT74_18205, partial [Isosphaeraceae bacterium]|nr:hypothetical protein [Isosphaeraceae bacterium]